MTGNDEEARQAREDAQWRSIVDNYGEHPDFRTHEPAPEPPAVNPSLFEPPPFEQPTELAPAGVWDLHSDHFVPRPAPPVPRPQGLRLVAWLGLFGVPSVVLVCIVLQISLPSPLGFLALLWFVGGFGYLVATMNGPKDPDGGWDDGAVV